MRRNTVETGVDNYMGADPTFTEHLVPRGQGNVYARDHMGSGAAFVLMHQVPR